MNDALTPVCLVDCSGHCALSYIWNVWTSSVKAAVLRFRTPVLLVILTLMTTITDADVDNDNDGDSDQ